MGLYDGIKDVAKIVQQADNIDLYRRLLDLSNEALEMQAKIQELQEENRELKKQRELNNTIEYYEDPYITLNTDRKTIRYCAACWADKQKLVPLQSAGEEDITMQCPLCKTWITRIHD